MQKAWFGSRRRTKVRQRAKTRLKSHIKRGNPPNFSADFDILKTKRYFILIFVFDYKSGFCSALNEAVPFVLILHLRNFFDTLVAGCQKFLTTQVSIVGIFLRDF